MSKKGYTRHDCKGNPLPRRTFVGSLSLYRPHERACDLGLIHYEVARNVYRRAVAEQNKEFLAAVSSQ